MGIPRLFVFLDGPLLAPFVRARLHAHSTTARVTQGHLESKSLRKASVLTYCTGIVFFFVKAQHAPNHDRWAAQPQPEPSSPLTAPRSLAAPLSHYLFACKLTDGQIVAGKGPAGRKRALLCAFCMVTIVRVRVQFTCLQLPHHGSVQLAVSRVVHSRSVRIGESVINTTACRARGPCRVIRGDIGRIYLLGPSDDA